MPYVPAITTMIRLDHTHVVAAFHRYGSETAWWRKRAIVTSVCRALEIHAQLEEEIFYPALARIAPTDETLKKSQSEHDELRAVIGKLRGMGPDNAAYDSLFMELMRDTLHHVTDEETRLPPLAERALGPELRTLGAEMTRRRLQLLGEHSVEVAVNTAGTFPVATGVLVTLLAFGVVRLFGGSRRRRRAI